MARSLLASGLLSAALLSGTPAGAAEAGRVIFLSGSLVVAKADGRKAALAANSLVDTGDTLHAYGETRATVRFNDGSVVMLKPDSRLRIQEFNFEEREPARDKAIFALLKGGLRTLTGLIGKRNGNSYSMQTPTSTIGIRGTDYVLLYCADGACADKRNTAGEALADGLHVEVLEGAISVGNDAGSVEIGAGQFGFVKDRASAPSVAGSGYHDPANGTMPDKCTVR